MMYIGLSPFPVIGTTSSSITSLGLRIPRQTFMCHYYWKGGQLGTTQTIQPHFCPNKHVNSTMLMLSHLSISSWCIPAFWWMLHCHIYVLFWLYVYIYINTTWIIWELPEPTNPSPTCTEKTILNLTHQKQTTKRTSTHKNSTKKNDLPTKKQPQPKTKQT